MFFVKISYQQNLYLFSRQINQQRSIPDLVAVFHRKSQPQTSPVNTTPEGIHKTIHFLCLKFFLHFSVLWIRSTGPAQKNPPPVNG